MGLLTHVAGRPHKVAAAVPVEAADLAAGGAGQEGADGAVQKVTRHNPAVGE
jgi:hypothetical protein